MNRRAAAVLALAAACAPTRPPPARAQLDWLLARFADGGRVDEPALRAHFAPAFLAARPPARLAAAFPALAGHLAGATTGEVTALSPRHLVLHGVAGPQPFAMTVVTDGKTGRIEHLDVGADVGPIPATTREAVARAAALAPRSGLLVAALDAQGQCRPRVAHQAAAPLALGSTFKLYVLLALVDRILDGGARWDDELALRGDWQSLPAPQDPPGTRLTLRALAERMIARSDNGATDHLLYHLGRDAVEAAARRAGNARNQPFLATRELFWLKMAAPPEEVSAFVAASPSARRDYLARIGGKLPTEHTDFGDWTAARHIDTIEWFASPDDLCRLAALLVARARDPRAAPLLAILSANRGLGTLSPVAWPTVGFKGGSEPGVATAAFILRRRDGAWFTVVLGANGRDDLDPSSLFGIATRLIIDLD